ncbi:MAG: glutathione S-transferase [Pseudomonadota bacterium]
MITLHHLENSRSQRILWLLEELGVDYEVRRYQRDPKTLLAPDELYQVHPLGKSPVITDGDRTIAESGAIIEYLVNVHGGGQFKPASDTEAFLDYTYWMHYAEGSLMPLMVMTLIFTRIPESPMPFFVRPVAKGICSRVKSEFLQPRAKEQLAFVDQHLEGHQWFAGEALSGADFQMSFPLEAAASRIDLKAACPNIAAYLQRIHAREAYQRALEKGGPYDYA